jgi:hypothetical protein
VERFVIKVQQRNRLPVSLLPRLRADMPPRERALGLVGALQVFIDLCRADAGRVAE